EVDDTAQVHLELLHVSAHCAPSRFVRSPSLTTTTRAGPVRHRPTDAVCLSSSCCLHSFAVPRSFRSGNGGRMKMTPRDLPVSRAVAQLAEQRSPKPQV